MGSINIAIEAHESIGSTSDRARVLADQGAPAGTCVLAWEQTEGRGQRGRTWWSPRGAGLYASFIMRPKLLPSAAPLLPLLSAVAARDAIESEAGVRLGIKWPNDLLDPVTLRKVAGILLEVASDADHMTYAIIGIGVNLREVVRPPAIANYATSLEALGAVVSPKAIIHALGKGIADWLESLENDGTAHLFETWRTQALGIGEMVTVKDGQRTILGVCSSLHASGALIVGDEVVFTGDLLLPGAPRPAGS